MKKLLISSVLVFSLFITLLGFNVGTSNAQVEMSNQGYGYFSSLPAGCTSTGGYSVTTGVKCDTVVDSSLPAGCTSTRGYSPTTGVKCDTIISSDCSASGYSVTTGEKCGYPAGCSSAQGYSVTTGQRCSESTPAAPVYPPGCSSNQGYSSTTGRRCNETNQAGKLVLTYPSDGTQWVAGTAYMVRWTNVQDPHVPKLFVTMANPDGIGKSIDITNQAGGYFPYLGNGMFADPQVKIPANVSPGKYIVFLTAGPYSTVPLSNVVYVTISGSTTISPVNRESIRQLYLSLLNREPEDAGMSFWSSLMSSGWTVAQVKQGILDSAEYQNMNSGCTEKGGYSLTTGKLCYTMANPSVTVLSPNGGETFQAGGKDILVRFETSRVPVGTSYEVALVGNNNSRISDFTAATGKTIASDWQSAYIAIPASFSGNYRIRVSLTGNCGGLTTCAFDQSDRNFTITGSSPIPSPSPTPSITVLSPKGGVIYTIGDKVRITWKNNQDAGNFNVVLYNVSTSRVEATLRNNEFMRSSGIDGVFADEWTILRMNSGKYRIEVYNPDARELTGRSGTFTIVTPSPSPSPSSSPSARINTGSLAASAISSLNSPTTVNTGATAASFRFTKFLEEGSYGNEVRELQKYLNGAGYDAGNADGVFGAKVKAALIKFQTDNKLKADGILGFEVRSFLNK